MKRSTVILLMKALVSLGLLFFLFSRIDVPGFLLVLSSARLSYLIIALAIYLVGQVISSVRWALLARPLGFDYPIKNFTLLYIIGMFFNLFAPSTIGGDVSRVFYLARDGKEQEKSWRESTAFATISVILDRAVGMAVMVWIGAVALAIFPGYSLPLMIRYPTFAVALGFLVGWILLPFLHRLYRGRDSALGRNLGRVVESYRNHRIVLMQTIGLSLFVHSIQVWMQILLGRALGVEIPWSYSFILYPLVGLFSALPITLNGIGLREGGYLYLLRQIDVSPEKAIAFGLLWFTIVALDSLIGGVAFVLRKKINP
ncbi:MAG: flippase-like domain-containing protein [Deltaproteobacteria bacterium]|nr:flippase-like domain-containing protein [Deltaproteobacteria bacterium]